MAGLEAGDNCPRIVLLMTPQGGQKQGREGREGPEGVLLCGTEYMTHGMYCMYILMFSVISSRLSQNVVGSKFNSEIDDLLSFCNL